jgi:hypothetical protein
VRAHRSCWHTTLFAPHLSVVVPVRSQTKDGVSFFLRCYCCPSAYCEDCVPSTVTHLSQDVPQLHESGYHIPPNVCYVLCTDFCKKYHADPSDPSLFEPVLPAKKKSKKSGASTKASAGKSSTVVSQTKGKKEPGKREVIVIFDGEEVVQEREYDTQGTIRAVRATARVTLADLVPSFREVLDQLGEQSELFCYLFDMYVCAAVYI